MRIVHTMIRVKDLDLAIDFYTQVLGMMLLRRHSYDSEGYTLAYVGYGSAPRHHEIELTYNHDQRSYTQGTSWGHLAIWVNSAVEVCERAIALGYQVIKEPSVNMDYQAVTAFVTDPDGHVIELIESALGQNPR
jgi:lactoylglutathione lyase